MASLARAVQQRLERFYDLPPLPSVDDFAKVADARGREVVLVREAAEEARLRHTPGVVEIAVVLPPEGLEEAREPVALDVLCQVVEGVSHFVYLAARILSDGATTQLELELQAEVDKFAMLAFSPIVEGDRDVTRAIHARLYERVTFLHDRETLLGERYRVANDLAARFCASVGEDRADAARTRLLRFYRVGQGEKIRLARAA